jgi:peptide/nickel transport system substrate-binding protein
MSIARILAIVLVASVLGACQLGPPRGFAPGGASGPSGGVLRVALSSDVVTLDPAMFTDTSSGYVSSQIHEPLLAVDFDQKIAPRLAEKWEQPQPNVYVFTLRRGVKFHNGEELTADDVKFSFERVMDPATGSPRAWRFTDAIESPDDIEVIDRYTVKLTLKQPFVPFLERLTQGTGFILNRAAVQAAGSDYARRPVGTGPFRLVELKSGEHALLERNPDYWGEEAKIERLNFRPIPDLGTRLAELQAGGIDHLIGIPPDEIGRLKAEGKTQVLFEESVGVQYLGYNTQKEPLTNPDLRRAINYAINRDEIVARLYGGIGQVAVSPLNPSSWAFNPDVERYPYNPTRAAEYLRAAGGAPAEPIELAFNQITEQTRLAERIQAQLKENLGLRVVLKPMEWGAFLNYLKSGKEHQLFQLAWTGDVDPDGTLFPLFHSKNSGAAGNRAFYHDDRVDALLSTAQRTVDQTERRRLYAEVQEIILRDAPWLPLRHPIISAALRPEVRGYRLHPLNNQIFTDVTVQ